MSDFVLPGPLERLADALGSLPGIGPKSAMKLAVYLNTTGLAKSQKVLIALKNSLEMIKVCSECGNLATEQLCEICKVSDRDTDILLLVELVTDLLQIEQAKIYKGRYLVLGGLISPINGIMATNLRLTLLETYLDKYSPKEVIIALSSTLEGEATSLYLSEHIKRYSHKHSEPSVTRLAKGLPTGVNIEYLDKSTLEGALVGRQDMKA